MEPKHCDLGIIVNISSGIAKVVVLIGKHKEHEVVNIKFRKEAGSALKKYMIVGITKDHQSFLYDLPK